MPFLNRKRHIILISVVLILLIAVLFLRHGARDNLQPEGTAAQEKTETEQTDSAETEKQIKKISETELKEKLVDPILGYYPGTAGSSLKRAVAATDVLSFAADYRRRKNKVFGKPALDC